MALTGTHDTLVYRLSQMLVKLNQGERLDPAALADEFGVNLRTIQRDLNERFAYLPLTKVDGRYQLEPAFLGKINLQDIERFAGLAGVSGLFPSLSNDFLRDIFDSRVQEALLIKGHCYENLAGKERQFQLLEKAIVGRVLVAIDYQKPDGVKQYPALSPYKLLNVKGIWYLAALDDGKLKTFSFAKIQEVRQLATTFDWSADVDARLLAEEGVWFGETQHEVILKISPDVAGYFKRRKLIANQVIEKELADGGLLLSAKVGHLNQVLPIVRYWLPHIRIVSPDSWQQTLEQGMKDYLQRIGD